MQASLRVFKYLPTLDAFVVDPDFEELSTLLGISEWSAVVWIGRLFCLDNDFGEHWFDNWDARERIGEKAAQLGYDEAELLIVAPEKLMDGHDGPCHSSEVRRAFWRDVLTSLRLSTETILAKAHFENGKRKEQGREALSHDPFVEDLEGKLSRWLETRKLM